MFTYNLTKTMIIIYINSTISMESGPGAGGSPVF